MTEPVRLKFCFGSMDAIQTNDWGCPSCDSRKQCFEKTKSRMEQQKMKANHDQPEPIKNKINEAVNHPDHYQGDGIECIDAIRAALGTDGFIAYCRGNAIKYAWRAGKKGPNAAEDMGKAAVYSRWATEAAL